MGALAIKLISDGDDALITCLLCCSIVWLSLWNSFNALIVHLSALIGGGGGGGTTTSRS